MMKAHTFLARLNLDPCIYDIDATNFAHFAAWIVVGEYDFERPIESFAMKHEKYGNIVREEILPGVVLYHLFDPADFEKIFRNSGKYPERLPFQSLKKDRTENEKAHGLTEL